MAIPDSVKPMTTPRKKIARRKKRKDFVFIAGFIL
jgi:hypothetical protein